MNNLFLLVSCIVVLVTIIKGQTPLPKGGCFNSSASVDGFECNQATNLCECNLPCCNCNTQEQCAGNNITCSGDCSQQGIYCNDQQSCDDSVFICMSQRGCSYLCEGERSCEYATFIFPTGTAGWIGCYGSRSCQFATGLFSSQVWVECIGEGSCRNSNFDFNFGDPVDDTDLIDEERQDRLLCSNTSACANSNVTMRTSGTVMIIGSNSSQASVDNIYGRCELSTTCSIEGTGVENSNISFDRGSFCTPNATCFPTFQPDRDISLAPSEREVIRDIEELLEFEEFRTVEGEGNNEINGFGNLGFEARRDDPREFNYSDIIGNDISGRDRINPRTISNVLIDQGPIVVNVRRLTNWVWQWGQFIDHDMAEVLFNFSEPLPIPIPPNDPVFSGPPFDQPATQIDFFRSVYAPGTGITPARPRSQMHSLTAFIDASTVYGSEEELNERLRTFENGTLKSQMVLNSQGYYEELLPFDEFQPAPSQDFMQIFLAGDTRSNEQNGLTAAHTLFVREHNRLARIIQQEHPDFDDEEIYDYARLIVSAIIQKITFDDWLPLVTGVRNLVNPAGYLRSDYDPNININSGASFTTFSFRVGHTMLPEVLQRLNSEFEIIPAGNQFLRDSFFNARAIFTHGVDPNLLGLSRGLAYEGDALMTDAVRNFLFVNTTFITPLDLAALNIWRGREWGLPDYNTIREVFGLPRIRNVTYISNILDIQNRLLRLYPNEEDLDRIDPFAGCSAETRTPGGTLGETNLAIWKDQFTRFRNGDRFYYERQFNGKLLLYIKKTTLKDVIVRNAKVNADKLQNNVFLQSDDDQVAVRQLRDNPPVVINDPLAATGGVQTVIVNNGGSSSSSSSSSSSRSSNRLDTNEEQAMFATLVVLTVIFFFCCIFSVWLFYYVYQAKNNYRQNSR